jgi:Ribonuclease H2 non-catalytic subunit (Ylr154p-like)
MSLSCTAKQASLALAADASTGSTSVSASSTDVVTMMECHALPCSIDYTGFLPTANVYFQPTSIISIVNGTDKKEIDDDTDADTEDAMESVQKEKEAEQQTTPQLQAACLRGRGLLSQVPASSSSSSSLAPFLHGRLLRIDASSSSLASSSSSCDKKTVHVEACFDSVQEWHHEHDASSLQLLHQQLNHHHHHDMTTTTTNRIQTALDWCQVAQALHAPLPIILE